MFEHLREWHRILVVGPQRSGTRIGAEMISHDTGFWFIPEEYFAVDSLNQLWRLFQTNHDIVVQAPALTCYAHTLGMLDPSLGVVMMMRPLEDILASQKKIRWRWEEPELIRLGIAGGGTGAAALERYYRWEHGQKDALGRQATEVEYESLSGHPLWVPKERRVNFGPRQTS